MNFCEVVSFEREPESVLKQTIRWRGRSMGRLGLQKTFHLAESTEYHKMSQKWFFISYSKTGQHPFFNSRPYFKIQTFNHSINHRIYVARSLNGVQNSTGNLSVYKHHYNQFSVLPGIKFAFGPFKAKCGQIWNQLLREYIIFG